MNSIIFSSQSDEWSTPQEVFEKLNQEFHFTLDPCSTDMNAKCSEHFTEKENGLLMDWGGHTVFCNPPYSDIGKWVRKSYREGTKPGTTVVMLIPARTDTRYFHNYIYHRSEIRFIKGRLHFNESQNSAPFPSMIVIFRGEGI